LRRPEKDPSPPPGPDRGSPGSDLELSVDSLAFGGEGVARHQGLVILVDGGVPGDRVRARLVHRSRKFARARILEILSPSPSRVAAPCPHFPECGGCSHQALDYPVQLEEKRRQVADLLRRIGRFEDPRVKATLALPEPFHYRSRMTYAIPTASGAGPGLHRRGLPGEILEVDACLLPEKDLQQAYLRLRADLGRLHPRHRPSHLEILGGERGERPVALLRGRGSPGAGILHLATLWTGEAGPLAGVAWSGEAGEEHRDSAARVRTLAGSGHVFRTLGPFRYRVPAGSFFQANTALATLMFEEVARRCSTVAGGILELYSGVGALSLFLAGAGRPLLALEGDRAAVAAALDNGRANHVEGIDFRVEKVGEALRRLEASPDRFGAVVADPPRSGLPPGAARLLGRLAREKILYLSCNPSTLARDLREIAEDGEWRLSEVIPADMFPQTAGIESLAELVPGGALQDRRSRISPSRRAS
jgi:23S rRNA (uracil1939-C5)-methyltransferase